LKFTVGAGRARPGQRIGTATHRAIVVLGGQCRPQRIVCDQDAERGGSLNTRAGHVQLSMTHSEKRRVHTGTAPRRSAFALVPCHGEAQRDRELPPCEHERQYAVGRFERDARQANLLARVRAGEYLSMQKWARQGRSPCFIARSTFPRSIILSVSQNLFRRPAGPLEAAAESGEHGTCYCLTDAAVAEPLSVSSVRAWGQPHRCGEHARQTAA
jgi:hypothetical protein